MGPEAIAPAIVAWLLEQGGAITLAILVAYGLIKVARYIWEQYRDDESGDRKERRDLADELRTIQNQYREGLLKRIRLLEEREKMLEARVLALEAEKHNCDLELQKARDRIASLEHRFTQNENTR